MEMYVERRRKFWRGAKKRWSEPRMCENVAKIRIREGWSKRDGRPAQRPVQNKYGVCLEVTDRTIRHTGIFVSILPSWTFQRFDRETT